MWVQIYKFVSNPPFQVSQNREMRCKLKLKALNHVMSICMSQALNLTNESYTQFEGQMWLVVFMRLGNWEHQNGGQLIDLWCLVSCVLIERGGSFSIHSFCRKYLCCLQRRRVAQHRHWNDERFEEHLLHLAGSKIGNPSQVVEQWCGANTISSCAAHVEARGVCGQNNPADRARIDRQKRDIPHETSDWVWDKCGGRG